MEANTGVGAQTIAQFLLRLKRYDPETGAYLMPAAAEQVDDYKTVVIDESSMLTEEQLASVLAAVKGVERLVLVGDDRQLPPIGAGRPFHDIVSHLRRERFQTPEIRVGRSYAELTIRRRQAGGDRDDLACGDWFSGRSLDVASDEIWDRLASGRQSDHIELVRWDAPHELENGLLERLVRELGLAGLDDENGFEVKLGGTRYRQAVYFHPRSANNDGCGTHAEHWQILSPVRVNVFGVESLNRLIQRTFRKRAMEWADPGAGWFRKTTKPFGSQGILYGDKVINTVNGYRRDVYPKGGLGYVANGEIGMVVGQYKGKNWKPKKLPWKLEVEFGTQSGFKYGYYPGDFSEERDARVELAYALTVHKAQGSEFGISFVVIPNPCLLLSRELLYTALTRQQNKVIVFHQGDLRELRRYGQAIGNHL